jgi:hypothetical protein
VHARLIVTDRPTIGTAELARDAESSHWLTTPKIGPGSRNV